MADDVARLVAVLEADVRGFTKGMEQANAVADKQFGALESRMRKTEQTFKSFGGGGGDILGLGKLFTAAAIEEFSRKVLTMTAGLVDQARVVGVSVEALQSFREVMKDAGGNAEDADQLLRRLTVSIGAAKDGATQATNAFGLLKLGPKDIEGTTEEVLSRVAKALLEIPDASQRARIETELFKRSGQEFERVLGPLASGLGAVTEKLREQNRLITDDSAETARKSLQGLAEAWSQVEVAASGPLTFMLKGFADLIEDAKVLIDLFNKLPTDSDLLHGRLVHTPTKTASDLPFANAETIGISKQGSLSGAPFETEAQKLAAKRAAEAALLIAKTIAEASRAAEALSKIVSAANVDLSKGTLASFSAVRDQIKVNSAAEINAINDELSASIAAAKKQLQEKELDQAAYNKVVNNLNDAAASKESAIIVKQRSDVLQSARDEIEARYQVQQALTEQRRLTISSEYDYILEISRGTQDYFKIAGELSDEDAKLQIKNIEDRLKHDLAFFDRTKQELDKAGVAYSDYEQEKKDATDKANLEIAAVENQASANRVRLNEQETHALENQIAVMDNVRGGLEDIGVSALHGATSFKQAVVQMIEQLAEMSLRLYVLRPLIESTFGRAGTGGGFLSDLLGFGGYGFPDSVNVTPQVGRASGGDVWAGRSYTVGENGPETFRPWASGSIMPSVPNAYAGSFSSGATINIDARGAQIGVAQQIEESLQRIAPRIVGAAVGQVRRNLGPMMGETSKRAF